MWIAFAAWISLTWSAFLTRETDLGLRLTKIDEAIRYVVIPAIFIVAIASLLGYGPLRIGEGTRWYGAKLGLYGFALCIGLGLRFVMRAWTTRFRVLAAGPNPAEEAALEREIRLARGMAYVYWITIASVCFLGATKPF